MKKIYLLAIKHGTEQKKQTNSKKCTDDVPIQPPFLGGIPS